jgi:cation-transporting ATPase E
MGEAAGNGLSRAEVDERIRDGALNVAQQSVSRSTADIVRANVFTRFNFILTVLLVAVLFAAPIQDALFGLVMVANTGIGIIQELRAKRQLERLAVVTAPTSEVIRDGRRWTVPVTGLVLGDLVAISTGSQLAVDGRVESCDGLEIDESLLTGESDPVAKEPGDLVLSGSFVVAGRGAYTATAVGADAYAAKLAEQARKFTLVRSELRKGIDLILAAVSWALVPAGVILLWSQWAVAGGVRTAVRNGVAGGVAMIPQGLVLVTSMAFAVGVVRLAQRRVLVQEMPAVEGLARVDVVCFDKTGTLTEGRLVHLLTEPLAVVDVEAVLAAMVDADPHPNATIAALRAAYPTSPGWKVSETVPFSSVRKWSAASFIGTGSFVFGAPDVLGVPDHLRAGVDAHTAAGHRVLLLASSARLPNPEEPMEALEPLALVVLGDRVRANARATLEFFAEQGVTVKVISGDHPRTVGAIARDAGVPGADQLIDGRDLPADPKLFADVVERGSVFGRITPQQKRAMVKALQHRGHVVAMSGDGVNDVLALKAADLGVAMGSGSEATKAVGQLVLVDGDFSSLPRVVAEGRRVIANIERVANLYVTKTIYAFALVVAVGVAGFEFPFLPRHLTLVGSITIGIPSFWLALEASGGRSEPGFISRVLRFSIPTGLLAALATFAAFGLSEGERSTIAQSRTMATVVLVAVGLFVLAVGMRPLNRLRNGLLWAMALLFAFTVLSERGRAFFALELPRVVVLLAGIGIVALAGGVMWLALRASGWLQQVPEVVRVTQEQVRSGRFSLARLRSTRLTIPPTDPPSDGGLAREE